MSLSKERTLQKQGEYGYTLRIPPDFLKWLGWDDSKKYQVILDTENQQLIIKDIKEN